MKNTSARGIVSVLARSLGIFIAFGVIAYVSRFIFNANLFDEEMLSKRALNAIHTAFLFLIFESTVWAFHRDNAISKTAFLDTCANERKYGKIKSIFGSLDFYTEVE